MATIDRVVKAAQIDFFCHGVGYSGAFIQAYLREGGGRIQERSGKGLANWQSPSTKERRGAPGQSAIEIRQSKI
jgi:hypothetical protein